MSLLNSFTQVVERPQLRGARYNDVSADIISGVNAGTVTIPYGCITVIANNTTPSPYIPPVQIISANDDVIVGLSVLEYNTEESYFTSGEAGIPVDVQFPIAKKGEFRVFSETANQYGDPVYVRIAPGAGGTKVGFAFRNAPAGTEGAETLLLSGCYWCQANSGTNVISAIHIDL